MSKRPLIILKDKDMEFISDYLEKHNIHKYQMCEIDPPYENYDAICEIEDEGSIMQTKYRWQTLPSNGVYRRAKVFAKFIYQGKILNQINIQFSWYIAKDEEGFMLAKGEDKENELKSLMSMWEILGISKEKMESLKKSYFEKTLPCLLCQVEECSKNLKDEAQETISKKSLNLLLDQHCMMMLFLAYFKPEVLKYQRRTKILDDEVQKSKHNSSNSKKKKKKKSQTELVTVIPMSKFVQDVTENKLKLPRRKCPYAFQVRGHWREYKSGKRVWIKEFTKGDKSKHKKQTVVLGKRKEEE